MVLYRRLYDLGARQRHSLDGLRHMDDRQLDRVVQHIVFRRELELRYGVEQRRRRDDPDPYFELDFVADGAGGRRLSAGLLLPITGRERCERSRRKPDPDLNLPEIYRRISASACEIAGRVAAIRKTMRKVCPLAAGLFLLPVAAFAQSAPLAQDSCALPRPLSYCESA